MAIKKLPFQGCIDITFRDGQQSPLMFDSGKYRFTLEDKKMLAAGLVTLGVRHFEFFAPNVNEAEKNDFKEFQPFMRGLTSEKISLLAHVRCHPDDIRQAIEAGFDGLNMYIGIAERAQKYSHGYTFEHILEMLKKTMDSVRSEYPDIYLRFSVEDCFRTPLADIYKTYDAIYPYVQTVGMPDTVGVATPKTVEMRVKALKKRYPKVKLECHFHNDSGLSVINALTAILNGAEYLDTSIWGMAERSGVTSITAILLNLYRENPILCAKYDLEHCYPLNVLMGTILHLQVPYNEPVSLTNRTHTAGVHQKAVLRDPSLYEAHELQKFGVTTNQLLLGPLSGWNLVYYYLREIEYLDVTPEEAKDVTHAFKAQVQRMGSIMKPEVLLHEVLKGFTLRKLPTEEAVVTRVENLQSI